MWLLKDPAVLRALLPTLARLVNVSLSIGKFPACLKVAVVTPILKKPGLDLNDLTNYRPVSNLQFIGKVLEKVVAEQLTRHLDAHSLRDDLQSAYRPGHSVETALLKIKDDMDMALDRGDGILVVLLDLSAAFDTLDHHILLDRLKHTCGLTDKVHQWLASYLGGRTQQVKVGESLSKPKQLIMGVPQGSVLGPLLFSIYYQPPLLSSGSMAVPIPCLRRRYADLRLLQAY